MLYYRNRKYWVSSTQKMRISSSARIYPEHCKVPTISEAYKTLIDASNLLTEMKVSVPHTAKAKLRHAKALQNLMVIVENKPNAREAPITTPTVSTSTDAKSPRLIQKTPSIHRRRKHRNTQMSEINESNNPNWESDTQQQSPTTKPTSLVPKRLWCQPQRVTKKRTIEG